MKKVIKVRDGEAVPSEAKYLRSETLLDESSSYTQWQPSPGIMGMLPIFGTETLYRITPRVIYHFYEIEIK